MRFETDAAAIDDPTDEQVEQGLRAMLSRPPSAFAILSLSPDWYIQTQVTDDHGTLVLQFFDGMQYEAVEPVPLDRAIAAFLSYLRQDGAWRSAFTWERVDL